MNTVKLKALLDIVEKADGMEAAQARDLIVDAFEGLNAKLELLNGTAASKLEKHNAEMELYKAQVIKLREEGKSWAMIAEITGINVSTVRSWVRNAK